MNQRLDCSVVAVGASGGQGLRDMMALVKALPPDLPAIVLLTLHRPADMPSHLAEILRRVSRLPVEIARDGEKLRPGACYVGEPARHLTLQAGDRARLVDDEEIHRNTAIDLLFESVATYAGPRAIGVVLSGALSDGSVGLEAIGAAGGLCMARAPDPGVVDDMPFNAIALAGPLDCVESVGGLAREIERLVGPAVVDG